MEGKETKQKDMTPILIKDLGMEYPTETSKRKSHYGLFKCQYCGKEFKTALNSVKYGATRSCGCINGISVIHGLRYNRFYTTWFRMMGRCYKPKDKDYHYYGARGITVCKEWHDVRKFIEWVEKTHIEGYTLDRIDNDKGYSPKNCRWADKTTQCINRRKMKNNKSGYIGVQWYKNYNKWVSIITVNKKRIHLGYFEKKMEAVKARDDYIKEHNLPHKLSTEY